MVKINVKKPFILNSPSGKTKFEPGLMEVEERVAEHWYVQAHCIVIKDEPVQPEQKKAKAKK